MNLTRPYPRPQTNTPQCSPHTRRSFFYAWCDTGSAPPLQKTTPRFGPECSSRHSAAEQAARAGKQQQRERLLSLAHRKSLSSGMQPIPHGSGIGEVAGRSGSWCARATEGLRSPIAAASPVCTLLSDRACAVNQCPLIAFLHRGAIGGRLDREDRREYKVHACKTSAQGHFAVKSSALASSLWAIKIKHRIPWASQKKASLFMLR